MAELKEYLITFQDEVHDRPRFCSLCEWLLGQGISLESQNFGNSIRLWLEDPQALKARIEAEHGYAVCIDPM